MLCSCHNYLQLLSFSIHRHVLTPHHPLSLRTPSVLLEDAFWQLRSCTETVKNKGRSSPKKTCYTWVFRYSQNSRFLMVFRQPKNQMLRPKLGLLIAKFRLFGSQDVWVPWAANKTFCKRPQKEKENDSCTHRCKQNLPLSIERVTSWKILAFIERE